ncbi:AAA family ATPase [Kitasatospora sp. P5_F3]
MVTVLVNGLPAAGKSTLARALASELRLPLFSKDSIKETLADQLTPGTGTTPREWSTALGRAASETLWTLLAHAPDGAVLESPWPADTRRFAVAGLARAGVQQVQEVWCDAPLAVLRRRYAERAAERHPVHLEDPADAEERWEQWSRAAQPLGLGPVHRVDTTRPVDIPLLARQITDRAASAPSRWPTG